MRIDKFYGINNQQKPTEFGLKGAEEALNVDITDKFKLVRRNGREQVANLAIDAASSTGEGEIIYQAGDSLYLMQAGYILGEKLADNLPTTGQLYGHKVNDQIIWSNGAVNGVIDTKALSNVGLGIKSPDTPRVSAGLGNMPAGQYMYAVTLVRDDGYESGAWQSGLVTIDKDSSVTVDAPDTIESGIAGVNLYLTHADGEVLYFARQESPGQTITYAGDTLDLIDPLLYQFCDKPEPFNYCCFYNGCMYYAVANTLYKSKPFKFGTIDYATDYAQFESAITMLEPAESGLFVSSERETSFLSGATLQEMRRNKVLDYGAIPGTSKRIYASTIVPEQAGSVVLWSSNRGLIAGFDSGQVVNLTDGEFAFPDSVSGTSALRETNGLRQLLISL